MKQPVQSIQTGKPFQGLKLAGSLGTRLAWHAIAALWLAAAVALVYPTTTHAATTYTWINLSGGTWSVPGNWDANGVADGAGNFANFNTLNITANRTVTLDSARTIGTIQFGDSSGNAFWTLRGRGVLTMDNTGGGATPPVIRAVQDAFTVSVVLAGTGGIMAPHGGPPAAVLLNAANTYTGDTQIDRSILRIGNVNALPSMTGNGRSGNVVFVQTQSQQGTLDLNAKSITINGLSSDTASGGLGTVTSAVAGAITLTVGDNNQITTFAGVIQNGSGSIALIKIGSGTLTLSGINAYTRATTISAGTLALSGSGSIDSSSAINLGGSGTFDVSGVSAPPYLIAAGKTLNGTGATGTIAGDLSLDPSASLALTYVSGTPTMNVSSGTLTLNGNATTVTITGSPLGDGSYKLVSKSGAGAVGGTVGSLTVAGAGIVGGGTAVLSIVSGELFMTISGGATVVEWGPANGTWANGSTGWGSVGTTTFANGNAALFSDAYSTGSPTITLNTEVLPQSAIMSSTKTWTITGTGDIGGSAEVRIVGPGTLTLDVANKHTGGTTLTAGRLNLKKDSALGDVSSTFTINGGTLDNTKGSAMATPNYPQAWNGNFVFAGANDLDLGKGAVTLGATCTVTVNGSKLTVGGDISGSGFGLIKAGAGALSLGGNNTFNGGLTITNGEVIVNNAGALNTATPNIVRFAADANTKTLSVNGNSLYVANLNGGSTAGYAVTTVRNNHASTPATLTVSVPSGTSQFIGTVADGSTAALAVTKVGSGIWMFGGGSSSSIGTYSGDTTIIGGTLRVGGSNLLPNGAGKGNVIDNATLDMYDRNVSINGLSGGGTVTATANSIANALTVGGGNASGSFSGVINNGASIGTHVSLTKIGTGTQTLSGVNTYTGTTTVNGGTLLVDSPGSLAAGSAVTVNATATLGGSGTINGPVTVNAGGSIAAGDSPGILTLAGGLDLSAGGTDVWELAALKDDTDGIPGTDFDQIALAGGSLALGGSSILKLQFTGTATAPDGSNPFWQSTHKWTIISASGAASDFAAIQNGAYGAGTFATSVEAGGIMLTFTPGMNMSIATGPGSNLTLSYRGGTGSQFVLLQTNDVAAPLNLWKRSQTNNSPTGSFTITPGSDPKEFYRVKSE